MFDFNMKAVFVYNQAREIVFSKIGVFSEDLIKIIFIFWIRRGDPSLNFLPKAGLGSLK